MGGKYQTPSLGLTDVPGDYTQGASTVECIGGTTVFTQTLYGNQSNGGKVWTRQFNGGSWGSNWQPVYTGVNYQPDTSLGIGVVRIMKNDTGANIIDGSSVSGSDISRIQLFSDNTTWLPSGAIIPGTWVNVEGGDIGTGNSGNMVRVA